MGSIIAIDMGNSTIKGTALLGSEVCGEVRVGLDAVDELVNWCGGMDAQGAIVSSVSADAQPVVTALQACCPHVMELTAATPLPITVGYRNPQQLGADRVAAAVGAWALLRGHDTLVVDVGSAVTLDLLTAEGHLMGGNISAGVAMRLRALHDYTQRLPQVSPQGPVPIVGQDTEGAMRAGAVRGVVAEIEAMCARLASMGVNVEVVLTGGDAPLLLPHMAIKPHHREHLVAEGLNEIFRRAEEEGF